MRVLDTSALIEVMHGTDKGKLVMDKLENEQAAMTSLNVFEIFRNLKPAETAVFRNLLSGINILDFDSAAALESVRIEKELANTGEKIGILDVLIAGICKKHSSTLITADRDFAKIKGLKTVVLQ